MFTIPSNPFVQAADSTIEFCAGCDAFVQSIDWSNEPINTSQIIEMQYNPIVVIDLEQPICPIGEYAFEGACLACNNGCNCNGSADNCFNNFCWDRECASCENSSTESSCNDCSKTGRAELVHGVC
jgi:hypothetical protein